MDVFHIQTLEQMSSQYQASYQEAQAKYNLSKNRFPDKLPSKEKKRGKDDGMQEKREIWLTQSVNMSPTVFLAPS